MQVTVKDEINDWWVKTLLGQQASAHPIFGRDIDVQVDGGVVTLSGKVEDADQARQIEREARSIDSVREVINRLTVIETGEPYHMQTVLALFPDRDSAALICREIATSAMHEGQSPEVIESEDEARQTLAARARAAEVPGDAFDSYLDAVRTGKALLMARVPEDDALEVISVLEGSRAECIRTLPPEPAAIEV